MYSSKQIEELKQSEEKYHTMFETMEQGVVYQDSKGKIISANPAAERILGLKFEELQDKSFIELGLQEICEDGKTFPRKEHPSMKALGTGKTIRNVVIGIFNSKEKEYRWVNTSAVPQYRPLSDKPYQVFTTFEDITERKKEKELGDTLNDINSAINSTLDFDKIMDRVVVQAAKAIGCESVGVILREERYWVLRYVHGTLQKIIGRMLTEDEARATVLAATTRQSVIINDAYNDIRVNRKIVKKYKMRSYMVVPLVVRDKVIGTLAFFYHSKPVVFNEAEIDFASKLAVSISLAVENARLYEAERSIADTLQDALLTMPEKIEGVDFGHLYRSATEIANVGGDFYDLFEIEHGKVGIIIGDVSGKGLEAATLTSLVKNTIKAYAYQNDSPASILSKTNKVFKKSALPEIFVTVFFGILNIESGSMVYCNAGHPPAILKAASPETFYLSANSPIIGILEDAAYIENIINIKKGDFLILYTDGVIEAKQQEKLFGEKRLSDLIKKMDKKSAKEFPEAIFQKVLEFSEGMLADDLALLAVSLS